jgi:pimeloyl-ACP methyl ester carboxylesterase
MPFLHVNGTDIHCHATGREPAVVMVHPPFIGSSVFNYLKHDLSRDHRVVVFDVRGHGHSPPGDATVTIPIIAEDIRQLMDRLDIESAYACGYSCGAMPVLEALLSAPGRFRGAVLLSGMSELSERLSRMQMRAGAMLSGVAREAVVVPVALGNADSRTTFGVLHEEGKLGDARRCREYAESCLRYSCTGRLSRIDHPVLLLSGAEDQTGCAHARMLHGRLRESEWYKIRGAGHHLPTKAPDRTSAVIRAWIAKLEGRDAASAFAGLDGLAGELVADEADAAAREGERL